MSNDKVFVDGLFFNLPRENSPEFVKGNLNIDMKKFIEWCAKITVPKLVTPGSPSPLEISFTGIAAAEEAAAKAAEPEAEEPAAPAEEKRKPGRPRKTEA